MVFWDEAGDQNVDLANTKSALIVPLEYLQQVASDKLDSCKNVVTHRLKYFDC